MPITVRVNNMKAYQLGLYEKSMPKTLSWEEKLELTKLSGFDWLEISIDETDEKLARLDWTEAQRNEVRHAMEKTGVKMNTMCLSGHRKYPLGTKDEKHGSAVWKSWEKLLIWQLTWEFVLFSWLVMMYIMIKEMRKLRKISLQIFIRHVKWRQQRVS